MAKKDNHAIYIVMDNKEALSINFKTKSPTSIKARVVNEFLDSRYFIYDDMYYPVSKVAKFEILGVDYV